MKYAVDEIIDQYVRLENIDNNEIIELEKRNLPDNLKEGNILRLEDGVFVLDLEEEDKRRKILQEKLNRLKGIKSD